MREETKTIMIDGVQTKIVFVKYDESDRKKIRELYYMWLDLNRELKKFSTRGVNFPEGISEPVFCMCFGDNYGKALKVSRGSASFDVINLKTGIRIQVKATSNPKSPTSFGPTSVWDEIYFLDFYRKGNFDKTFDVYKPENNWIYECKVNKQQTFRDQQKLKLRPRFNMMNKIIKPRKLKPIKTCTI